MIVNELNRLLHALRRSQAGLLEFLEPDWEVTRHARRRTCIRSAPSKVISDESYAPTKNTTREPVASYADPNLRTQGKGRSSSWRL